MVAGQRLEPLLVDKDVDTLGIINFTQEGREPTKEERGGKVRKLRRTSNKATTTPSKLREAGVNIKTGKTSCPRLKRRRRTSLGHNNQT